MMYNKENWQNIIHFVVTIIVSTFFLSGCKSNSFDIDVSDIDIELNFYRYDKELLEIPEKNFEPEVQKLKQKHSAFFDLYNLQIVPISRFAGDTLEIARLKEFVYFPSTRESYAEIQKIFPDTESLKEAFREAFRHYKYHFPQKKIPAVYICFSSFNYAAFTDENILGAGIEMYLGRNCKFYKNLGVDNYKIFNFYPERLVANSLYAWALADFPNRDSVSTVITNVLYQAKIQYFLDAMLPDVHDSIKFGFTAAQLEWCHQNEKIMWAKVIERKILFENTTIEISKYTGEGPFTTGFPRSSPARAMVWLGREIIRSYMSENEEVTFQELMQENDYNNILNKSRYKP